MRTMLLLATFAAAMPRPASAAHLRPYSQVADATVHLADLFSDLGNTPDRVLGAAPAPGAHIVVPSPQLAAIARDFGVDWRPQTGTEQATIERTGETLPASRIIDALHRALADAGAGTDFDIAAPGFEPVLVPIGSHPEPAVAHLDFDAPTGRFTALIGIALPGAPPTQLRISGEARAMLHAATATHHLAPGAIIAPSDVRTTRVRASALRNEAAIGEPNAVGMAARHDIPAGQILTDADLTHPALVERGSLVRMSLNSDGLALSAQGIAKESGAVGDQIHVENPLSHLIVLAEVTGQNEVRVAPRTTTVTLVSVQ